ncbi:helix-turn-helix domain-containing protein [Yoonia sp. MH D7]
MSQVTRGALTAVTAANVLGPSRRQFQRLLKDLLAKGPAAIRHKARRRGRTTGLILRYPNRLRPV